MADELHSRYFHPKNIFCLEGDWWGIRDRTTVAPMLELLNRHYNNRVRFIHRNIATPEEFEFYLKKWTLQSQSDYPILYLGFHGEANELLMGDKRGDRGRVTMEWLADRLEGRQLSNRVIFFGSCATFNINGHRLNHFVKRSGVDAICGYSTDVDWALSAAFELIVLNTMQFYSFSLTGLRAMEKSINRQAGAMAKTLSYRMVMRKPR